MFLFLIVSFRFSFMFFDLSCHSAYERVSPFLPSISLVRLSCLTPSLLSSPLLPRYSERVSFPVELALAFDDVLGK
jgi:hypothetical protein